MATFNIKPEELAGALAGADESLRTALRAGARAGAMRGHAHMPKKTPTDMGQLRNSWRVSEAGGVRLYNDAPQAGIVEEGARPHPVSEEGWMAIFRWVMRHPELIGAGASAVGSARKKLSAKRLSKYDAATSWITQQAAEITNAICHKIRLKGQEPTYFTRNEMPLLTKFAKQEIDREIQKALNLPPKVKKGASPKATVTE